MFLFFWAKDNIWNSPHIHTAFMGKALYWHRLR